MIKVTELAEKDLREIGLAYANYGYPDNDKGMFPFDDKEMLTNYIVGFARACMQAGMLYTTSEKHEGYIAITTPDTRYQIPVQISRYFCTGSNRFTGVETIRLVCKVYCQRR